MHSKNMSIINQINKIQIMITLILFVSQLIFSISHKETFSWSSVSSSARNSSWISGN